MLRTRLIVGTILAALAGGMLLIDERFAPRYPFLFATVGFLSAAGTIEMWRLLPLERRPYLWVVLPGVLLVVAANWWPLIRADVWHTFFLPEEQQMRWPLHAFTLTVLATFIAEMATFRESGHSVVRIATSVWFVAYLGLLPSYLVQLRLGLPLDEVSRGKTALAMAIFVPKACDIGAYFTGRLIGRHRMTPVLSPKKTWEGAIGGLVLACVVAYLFDNHESVRGDTFGAVWRATAIGLSLGLAGLLGDLAESLIKRDCQQKDASQVVPGFGGVLDVVDAILFAAPVAYWWFGRY